MNLPIQWYGKPAWKQASLPGISFSGTFSPFHPYKKGNLLTNRTPSEEELAAGLAYTRELLSLTGPLPLFAIGKRVKIPSPQQALPSPASGILPTGAPIFPIPAERGTGIKNRTMDISMVRFLRAAGKVDRASPRRFIRSSGLTAPSALKVLDCRKGLSPLALPACHTWP